MGLQIINSYVHADDISVINLIWFKKLVICDKINRGQYVHEVILHYSISLMQKWII